MGKYRVTGRDAEAYLNRLITRDVSKIREKRVGYTVWCDDEGQVLDDGTIFHLGPNDYRICAYARAIDWLLWSAEGFDVCVEEETPERGCIGSAGADFLCRADGDGLVRFGCLKAFWNRVFDFEVEQLMVSRTGFTR